MHGLCRVRAHFLHTTPKDHHSAWLKGAHREQICCRDVLRRPLFQARAQLREQL